MRAKSFASSTNTGLLYCAAKDIPSLDALRARPDLPTQKMKWLKRHVRESGDLYGVLPLMKGMPVAMTDQHIQQWSTYFNSSAQRRVCRFFCEGWKIFAVDIGRAVRTWCVPHHTD